MPDFDFKKLRLLANEMQRLAAFPTTSKNYAVAQVALEKLKGHYAALKDEYQAQYGTDPANPQRGLALSTTDREELGTGAVQPLGLVDTGVMSATQMMTMGAARPAAAAAHALIPGGPTGSDVNAQWEASMAATDQGHELARGAGMVAGTLALPIASKLIRSTLGVKSLAPVSTSPALKAVQFAWQRFAGARRAAQAAVQTASKVAPSSSAVAKVGAEKAVAVTGEAAQSAAQQLAASLAKAQAEALAIETHAKVAALVKNGFALEDAVQMVKTGATVPKALVAPFLRGAKARAAKGLPLLGS